MTPERRRMAAEIVVEEPAGVDESDLKDALRDTRRREGEDWDDAQDALLAALGQVRKHAATGGEEVAR